MATTEIIIPLERFEQLIKLEERVNVTVERIMNESYLSTEDLLWSLGTELSCTLAQELKEKKKAEKEQLSFEQMLVED